MLPRKASIIFSVASVISVFESLNQKIPHLPPSLKIYSAKADLHPLPGPLPSREREKEESGSGSLQLGIRS